MISESVRNITKSTSKYSAHFQETTESLSVLDLMCWRTEGTFITAWYCCGVYVILAPDTKLQTYLLPYLHYMNTTLCE